MQVKLNSETVNKDTIQGIKFAIASLVSGNAEMARGKKTVEQSKAYLARQLAELRGIKVEELYIGEICSVMVDNTPCFNVVIGKQNRLDLATLETEQPAIVAKYKKDFPTISYKLAI
jgi:hypothetical protein